MPGSIPAIGHPLELVVALEAVVPHPVALEQELETVELAPVALDLASVATVPHLEPKIAGDCPDCSSGMRLPQVSCLL